MKCPLCGAVTKVNQTMMKDGFIVRRRECWNLHTYMTKEIHITEPKPKRQRNARGKTK